MAGTPRATYRLQLNARFGFDCAAELAPYLEVNRRRSIGQIASVVLPYLAIWPLAVLIQPSAPLAIVLGLRVPHEPVVA